MTDPAGSTPTDLSASSWRSPPGLALIVAWLATTATMLTLLLLGVRHTDGFAGLRRSLHVAYVLVLLWYVAGSGARFGDLPAVRTVRFRGSRAGQLLPVLIVLLVLVLAGFSDDGMDVVMLLLIAATPWLLIAWRQQITGRAVLIGSGVAVLAFLAGLPAWLNGFVSGSTVVLLAVLAFPMFVAGVLIAERTRLGGASLLTDGPRHALGSFLMGCLLFVPLGLVNAVGGSPGSGITWVDQWWMPITLPFFSGIAEEVWFRLLLVGLCYYLVRPAFGRNTSGAVILAVLFSAATFGLGHGRDLEHLLVTGMLYGLPMAWLFVRHDWEHAVGAHYMVNMIPWIMVLREATG